MKADLHSHTNHSDGHLTVDHLLDTAIARHIDVLAITDHDTFSGVMQAINTKKPIKVVIGIELSTYRKEESVHILGYFSDIEYAKPMQDVLDIQLANRRVRAQKMVEALKSHFNIDLNIDFFANLNSITRGSIAREIIRQGFPYTQKEIFKTMIGQGCPAYLPSSKMSTQEGIHLIKQHQGLAVLAHPANLKVNRVEDIIALGIDGIEAVYPNRQSEEGLFRQLAKQHQLIITGGTDFHMFDDGQHGNIGDVFLKGQDVDRFLKVLYER